MNARAALLRAERSFPALGPMVNFIRQYGDFGRRFLGCPLRSLPELTLPLSGRLNYGSESLKNRLISEQLIMAVEYAHAAAVGGHVAEFGTFSGRTARALACAISAFRWDRRLLLFDSFEGLPEPGPRDQEAPHVKSGIWAKGQMVGCSPETLRRICRKFLPDDQIRIFKGWFKDTLPLLRYDDYFAVVHLDCDLYQSTYDVLFELFRTERIAEGAVLLFDDWNCNRASDDAGQRRAWLDINSIFEINYNHGGDYAWGGHKIIVQNYSKNWD